MKPLGLLITSDRYTHYAIELVRAASAKGVPVRIHFTAPVRQLADHPAFSKLTVRDGITVSAADTAALQKTDKSAPPTGKNTTDSQEVARLFQDCDRYVVL